MNGAERPTPEEARAALADVEGARRSLDRITNPWWFTLALAGYMAAVALTQMLPPVWAVVVCLLLAGMLGAIVRISVERTGVVVRFRGVHLAVMVAGTALVLTAFAAGTFVESRYGAWVWYPVAAANTAVILGIDLFYRMRARRAK